MPSIVMETRTAFRDKILLLARDRARARYHLEANRPTRKLGQRARPHGLLSGAEPQFDASRMRQSAKEPPASVFMKTALPKFRERAPWWGGDLQTLRNLLVSVPPLRSTHASRRISLPLDDGTGDALSALLNEPSTPSVTPTPLIVAIHGLAGSEDSAYMNTTAAHWLDRQHAVLRINLRGAGPSSESCRFRYHAGRTEDLAAALRSLETAHPEQCAGGLVLIGYSLGGNMLLKFLADFPADPRILAAATVSAPIDLLAGCRRLHEPRNTVYQRSLLRSLVAESVAGKADLTAVQREAIQNSRSIYEFDEYFVAPANDFDGANDYYQKCSADRFLGGIQTPTLVVHATNDPWIPSQTYTDYPWQKNSWLSPCLLNGGGHVGFHGQGLATPWHDHAIEEFVHHCQEEGHGRQPHGRTLHSLG